MTPALVFTSLVLAGLHQVVTGQADHGPGYQLVPGDETPRYCNTDRDCRQHHGEVCWWFYDGCAKGQCMCDPRSHRVGSAGKCEPVKLGGARCSLHVDCPESMACVRGACACMHGYMAPDHTICLLSHHKLLGQECLPFDDTCVQRASYGYTDHEVQCSKRGECQCVAGYKRDGYSCRKWDINERGCTESYQCQGGAVCVDGQCVCPTGYSSVAYNTKCAKNGAITELPIGAGCDEVNEQEYCAAELVCHKCGGEHSTKCVRFLMVETRPPVSKSVTGGGAGALVTPVYSHLSLLLTCAFYLLITDYTFSR